MIEIVYKDVPPAAKKNMTASASEKAYFIDLQQLAYDNIEVKKYADLGGLYATALDGNCVMLPSDLENTSLGYWSEQISGDNGALSPEIQITLAFNGAFTSQGITLFGDSASGSYANDVSVTWYYNGGVLYTADFQPNKLEYFYPHIVENYNKIDIIIKSMNMPQNRYKLPQLELGVVRRFSGDNLEDGVSVIQQIHVLSEELPANTADYGIVSDEDVQFIFQRKQPFSLYLNGVLQSVTFVEESHKNTTKTWQVSTTDYKGLLEKINFDGGMYSNKNAGQLIDEILGKASIPYTIDDVSKAKTVSGYLEKQTCREALTQVLFAIQAVCDTSKSDALNIFRLPEQVSKIYDIDGTQNIICQGQTSSSEERITEVRLTEHYYKQTTETMTAYEAEESGTGTNINVEFSEPLTGLKITNGTIISSTVNGAIINANAGCVLTGYKYEHTQKVISKKDPLFNAGEPENVKEVDSMTLVNASNSRVIINALYDYYYANRILTSKLVGELQCGEKISVESEVVGTVEGYVEEMRYTLYAHKKISETIVRG